jgi:hypothetical protein
MEVLTQKQTEKINTMTPNFTYINHLGVLVTNIKTATL